MNPYLIKALDAYPFDLEGAVENLQYALSYEPKNVKALTLMGRLYTELFKEYEEAKSFFEEALAEDVFAIEVYPFYLNVLILNEDYKEAFKLVDFALTIKGIDKGMIYRCEAFAFEKQGRYKKALKSLKKAKIHSYNEDFNYCIGNDKSRVKGKMPKVKTKKKKKKS